MPVYEYRCDANGTVVDVRHPMDVTLATWLEVCYVAQRPIGDTDPLAPVRRTFTRAPSVHVTPGNAELRNLGFSKLVRRADGRYENVTAGDGNRRIVSPDED